MQLTPNKLNFFFRSKLVLQLACIALSVLFLTDSVLLSSANLLVDIEYEISDALEKEVEDNENKEQEDAEKEALLLERHYMNMAIVAMFAQFHADEVLYDCTTEDLPTPPPEQIA